MAFIYNKLYFLNHQSKIELFCYRDLWMLVHVQIYGSTTTVRREDSFIITKISPHAAALQQTPHA